MTPHGDEIIIDKTRVSTLTCIPIEQILRNMGIDPLLVCGTATNGCVKRIAPDAVQP